MRSHCHSLTLIVSEISMAALAIYELICPFVTDTDECETGVHRCGEGQICHNLPGTYRCDCRPGYQYDTYRRMCVGETR